MKAIPSASAVLAACGVPLLCAVAFGQDRRFTPADFAPENRLVGLQLRERDIDEGQFQALIRCQGFVKVDGTIAEENCIALDSRAHQAQLQAVLDAVPMQRFRPATVDGEPVQVYMSFAVLFACADRACQSIPLRNHGQYFQQHGLAYFDPQPILGSRNWYTSFEDKLEWTRQNMPTVGELLRSKAGGQRSVIFTDFSGAPVVFNLTAEVGVDGTARDVQVTTTVGGEPDARLLRDAEPLIDAFVQVSFIPGFGATGEPVVMRYIEPVIDIDVL